MTETKTITKAIGTFGGDFSRWPDRDLARRAMEESLSDRDARAALDEARALDRGLASARLALDGEFAGAAARVVQATLASVAPPPFGRWRWAAAVAILVTAAGLGSIADIGLAGSEAPTQVVVVDPLIFGPIAGDDQ
jgi:hypothetical protein